MALTAVFPIEPAIQRRVTQYFDDIAQLGKCANINVCFLIIRTVKKRVAKETCVMKSVLVDIKELQENQHYQAPRNTLRILQHPLGVILLRALNPHVTLQ